MTSRIPLFGNAAFVAIHVAFARDKLLPVCICIHQHELLLPPPLGRRDRRPPRARGNAAALGPAVLHQCARNIRTHIEAVAQDERVSIARIAIDAPHSYADAIQSRRCDTALSHALSPDGSFLQQQRPRPPEHKRSHRL